MFLWKIQSFTPSWPQQVWQIADSGPTCWDGLGSRRSGRNLQWGKALRRRGGRWGRCTVSNSFFSHWQIFWNDNEMNTGWHFGFLFIPVVLGFEKDWERSPSKHLVYVWYHGRQKSTPGNQVGARKNSCWNREVRLSNFPLQYCEWTKVLCQKRNSSVTKLLKSKTWKSAVC